MNAASSVVASCYEVSMGWPQAVVLVAVVIVAGWVFTTLAKEM